VKRLDAVQQQPEQIARKGKSVRFGSCWNDVIQVWKRPVVGVLLPIRYWGYAILQAKDGQESREIVGSEGVGLVELWGVLRESYY
jgi:hypothetical protein